MKKIKIVFSILLIGLILFTICACGSSGDNTYSATCQVCHKTYSYEGAEYGNRASREVKCINYTNMCISCYENMCYAKGMTPRHF